MHFQEGGLESTHAAPELLRQAEAAFGEFKEFVGTIPDPDGTYQNIIKVFQERINKFKETLAEPTANINLDAQVEELLGQIQASLEDIQNQTNS